MNTALCVIDFAPAISCRDWKQWLQRRFLPNAEATDGVKAAEMKEAFGESAQLEGMARATWALAYGAPGLVTTYFVQNLFRAQNFPDFLFTW